jgi:hypothetical protein
MMISRTRRRITFANVAATLALVFAMSGGAYAATKYLITSTKQISPKVLKALKGKKGAKGTNGATGANGVNGKDGAPGAPGARGEKGSPGENGAPGAAGKDGTSVTSATLPQGNETCKEGGSEFVAATNKKTYACNGSPWVASGILPKGATETGTWVVESTASATEELMTAVISFPIPVSGHPNVTFVAAGTTTLPEHCEGSVENPGAESGHVCVFEGESPAVHLGGLEYASAVVGPDGGIGGATQPTGGQLVFKTTRTGRVSAEGTWAVTG